MQNKINEVTGFSKLVAIILFILLPIITFLVGYKLGASSLPVENYVINIPSQTSPTPEPSPTESNQS
jgi:hypothetical protein